MRRRQGSLLVAAVCLLLSAGVNLAVVVGLTFWWTSVDPRPPPEKTEITYLDLREDVPETKPKEPPKPALPPKPKAKPQPEKKKPKPERARPEEKQPEIELEELPEPEPEPEPKPEPEPEPEKKEEAMERPPDFIAQLKMVDQPDELHEDVEIEAPDFLSDITRDVKENTQAQVTNLEKDAVKPEASQLEPSPKPEVGTASEDVIAQAETQESKAQREAPKAKPEEREERVEQVDPKPKSLLAMRELDPRDHKLAEQAHDALASEADDGRLRKKQEQQDSVDPQEQQARVDKHDKKNKFKLSQEQLQALYGKDQVAKARVESLKESKKAGIWEKQRENYQSPLENFVPEVQPGNQTALRSKRHPFARYIAHMHRKIHDAWAWGFLDQLDARNNQHPLNDYKLWTRVEIVLNGDGTIDKLNTVRHSGKLAFDAAAREIVHAAGPFPNPPKEIISGNGKVYIHWAFHRDERACGTFGAQPFILDGSGTGDRPDPNVRVVAGKGGEATPRRLRRGTAGGTAPKVAEGPALPPGTHDHDHDEDHDHGKSGDENGAGSGSGGDDGDDSRDGALETDAKADDPAAKKAANAWIYYFWQGEIAKAVAQSSLPFYSGDAVVARTRVELTDVLASLSAESKAGGKPKGAKMYTAAGLRKVFGSVPSGIQEGNGRIYALTKIKSEYVILLLEKKFGSWRVVGVAR